MNTHDELAGPDFHIAVNSRAPCVDDRAVEPCRLEPCRPENGVGLGASRREFFDRPAGTVVDPDRQRSGHAAID